MGLGTALRWSQPEKSPSALDPAVPYGWPDSAVTGVSAFPFLPELLFPSQVLITPHSFHVT